MTPTSLNNRQSRSVPSRLVRLTLLATSLVACGPEAPSEARPERAQREDTLPSGGWRTLMASGGAPIRSITRRSDGVLLGGASTGHGITVWSSGDNGASWTVLGSVASNAAVEFGDVNMLAIPGTNTVFCAFREYANGQFRVTVTRSDNGGAGWVYDSTVVGPVSRFVGAPFLFRRASGDLQVYYDSEELAAKGGFAGHQWIAMQGRAGLGGAWTAYGTVTVARDKRAGALSREGMATVVQLGGDRLMAVVEGVEPFTTGGVRANIINAVESWDGGRTWDDSLRRVVYQSPIHSASGRRYNAYVPFAIRVGNGPVGVAFCTDEDKGGTPDLASTPPDQRSCHVGYVSTTSSFETWSSPSPVWTATSRNYTPGLFERAPNDVIAVIDGLGTNRVLVR
jgi:hypothetical protein